MDKSLRVIAFVFMFFIFLSLIVDLSKLREMKELTKDCLDLATKAAALQINEDPEKIAEANFEINEEKSKQIFIDVMAMNLGSSKSLVEDCLKDYKAINTGGTYTHPNTGLTYLIEEPTFVAVMEFQYDGIILKKSFIVSNSFAGSELLGKKIILTSF